MSRTRPICAVALALFTTAAIRAEEPAPLIEELRALRQMVEQQSKQLETLTRQVAKLAGNADAKATPAAEPEPAVPNTPAPAAAPASEDFTTVRKAEAAGPPKHVVVKGETLTSIAKHYNIPLAELLKANKEVNERKLQIGQTISIPLQPGAAVAKPVEPPTEKTP